MAFTQEEIKEFEATFGLSSASEEGAPASEEGDTQDISEEAEESTENEEGSEETEEESDADKGEETERQEKESRKQAQQNHAFAELRKQNKEQGDLIRRLGKLIGLEDGTDFNTVTAKVGEMLLQKESEKTGIPPETLQRISALENLVEENKQIKLQYETQDAFTQLIEKYELSDEDVTAFTHSLIEDGKNPLEVEGVDIESEYLKRNFDVLLTKAVDEALSKEAGRKNSVENHASSAVINKKGTEPTVDGDYEIDTISDLEKYLNEH